MGSNCRGQITIILRKSSERFNNDRNDPGILSRFALNDRLNVILTKKYIHRAHRKI